MNILLTGASGLVGSAFARVAAEQGHRVVGLVGGFSAPVPGLAEKQAIDLADSAAVDAFLRQIQPHAIVNCAAVAAPDACETDPVRSQALNVALPAKLALLAQRVKARLVHLSSEQVFDGRDTRPYTTADQPAPLNLYGRQKRESEQLVQDTAGTLAVTVRPPLLMGNSLTGRRGLHEALLAQWARGERARLYADEFRQTCTGENLARVALELCERPDLSGIFHWAGTELASRFALAQHIRTHFRLSPERAPIDEVWRADTPAVAARRPACLALDITPLVQTLRTRPQTLADQLAELSVPAPGAAWYAGG